MTNTTDLLEGTRLDALEANLRKVDSDDIGAGLARNWHRNPDGPDAAKAIALLRQRVAMLEGEIERLTANTRVNFGKALAFGEENVRLRAALEEMLDAYVLLDWATRDQINARDAAHTALAQASETGNG